MPKEHQQSNSAVPSDYLNKEQLAQFLGVSKRTVDAWVALKYVPYYRLRRNIRFFLPDIQEWVKSKACQPEAEAN